MKHSGDETTRAAAEDGVLFAPLESRIGEMRAVLAAMQPSSTAAALRTLRDAFPDVPLETRVRALADTRH